VLNDKNNIFGQYLAPHVRMDIGDTAQSEIITCTSSCYVSICCWHPECFKLDFVWLLQTWKWCGTLRLQQNNLACTGKVF